MLYSLAETSGLEISPHDLAIFPLYQCNSHRIIIHYLKLRSDQPMWSFSIIISIKQVNHAYKGLDRLTPIFLVPIPSLQSTRHLSPLRMSLSMRSEWTILLRYMLQQQLGFPVEIWEKIKRQNVQKAPTFCTLPPDFPLSGPGLNYLCSTAHAPNLYFRSLTGPLPVPVTPSAGYYLSFVVIDPDRVHMFNKIRVINDHVCSLYKMCIYE